MAGHAEAETLYPYPFRIQNLTECIDIQSVQNYTPCEAPYMHLASNIRAIIPAAMGADAEVPVSPEPPWAHPPLRQVTSVVVIRRVASLPLLKVTPNMAVHFSA